MEYSRFKSLEITDFQAIADATINFGSLTVLTGAGDSGKSSCLRALRALCLNEAVDDDIRHGKKQLHVELTLENDIKICYWKKKGQGGCYSITTPGLDGNFQEFAKTQGAVPEEVQALLGVGTIELDASTQLTPQLSDQFDFPMLLFETGSKRARILGKATRLDTVIEAQIACKKERDEARRQATAASNALDNTVLARDAIPDYGAMNLRLEQCAHDVEIIKAEEARADRAMELYDRMAEVRSIAVVDVGKYTAWLMQADKSLDFAAKIDDMARRLPVYDRGARVAKEKWAETTMTLASLECAYVLACTEAGVCEECGGLLDHEECIV